MDLLWITQRHDNKFNIFAMEKDPPTDEGGKPTLDVPPSCMNPQRIGVQPLRDCHLNCMTHL